MSEEIEIADIDLDFDGSVLPEKNELIALVDADTMAYTACLKHEYPEDILPREFYTEEEYMELVTSPDYDEELHVIYRQNIDAAYAEAEDKLNRILSKTGCKSAELHFTTGKVNFRYRVAKTYKANRTSRVPAGLKEVKTMLLKAYGGSMRSDIEADDMVVYLRKTYPKKFLMVAVDKDLLNSVEGKHFNYYESAQWEKEMKFIETDAETVMKWPYIQALVGDTVDGIAGVRGIGKTKAPKLLADCKTAKECWCVVLNAYLSKGHTAREAIATMRLVDMHQYDGEKINLWTTKQFKEKK